MVLTGNRPFRDLRDFPECLRRHPIGINLRSMKAPLLTLPILPPLPSFLSWKWRSHQWRPGSPASRYHRNCRYVDKACMGPSRHLQSWLTSVEVESTLSLYLAGRKSIRTNLIKPETRGIGRRIASLGAKCIIPDVFCVMALVPSTLGKIMPSLNHTA